jgi:hypothetical protein
MSVGYTNPTIAFSAAATTSAAVRQNGAAIEGFIFPSAWTAASVTFQVSMDGSTWFNLLDIDGAAVTVAPVLGTAMMCPPGLLRGWDHLRLVSSVAQASAVTVTAVARIGL